MNDAPPYIIAALALLFPFLCALFAWLLWPYLVDALRDAPGCTCGASNQGRRPCECPPRRAP